MRFGLMRRSSREWVQTMSQLAQRAEADASQRVALQAEARRINDGLLAVRVKDHDPTRRRKTLDRMTGNLARTAPIAAAFLVGAEAPRRFQEERHALRARINLAVEAIEDCDAAEALSHMRSAAKMLADIEPGVFAPEAYEDLPRALQCVELMAQGKTQAAFDKTMRLLLDVSARGPGHPSMAQARVLRVMLVQVTKLWDRCDLLWEHKKVDTVLPTLLALLQMPHVYQLDRDTRQKIADAFAAKSGDVEAYCALDELAVFLRNERGAAADAAPLVRFVADRRLYDSYAAAQQSVAIAALTPDSSRQWAFNEACTKTLNAFWAEQKEKLEPEYLKGPRLERFEKLHFNADICLRALHARKLLDGQSSLEVAAMMYYFLEEMYLFETYP